MRVLDIGTGSGILGILALLFGAEYVTGVDVDGFTEEAVRQNLAQNGIGTDRFTLLIGNMLEDEDFRSRVSGSAETKTGMAAPEKPASKEGFDLAVANILPVVLKPLTPLVPRFLKPGGFYETVTEKIRRVDPTGGILRLDRKVTAAGSYMEIRIEDILDIREKE